MDDAIAAICTSPAEFTVSTESDEPLGDVDRPRVRLANRRDEPVADTSEPISDVSVEHHEAVADATPDEIGVAQIIESILFASDAALSAAKIAELIDEVTADDVHAQIAVLNLKYQRAGLSFRIQRVAGGFQMMTLPAYQTWLRRLHHDRANTRLSDAALETLSVIAYRQPVTRADIESIRGVACGEVVNRLRELGLVRMVGRAEVVGRPMLYGTTRKFLELFGLASLDELPPMEALAIRRSAPPAEPLKPHDGGDELRAAAGA
ncbi:MAG: Segregation and condensation protein B [Phycisphaerae bacterium]|nr:Segregation and condensation protein B [Phycisphaerae bacterium]